MSSTFCFAPPILCPQLLKNDNKKDNLIVAVNLIIYHAVAPQQTVAAALDGTARLSRHPLNHNAQEGRLGMCNGLASEDQDAGPTVIALRVQFFVKPRPLPFPWLFSLSFARV